MKEHTIEHHSNCENNENIHNHMHQGMKHGIDGMSHTVHIAFEELLREKIKMKLSSNKSVAEKIDKLADIGYSLIEGHLDGLLDEINKSHEEMKKEHK